MGFFKIKTILKILFCLFWKIWTYRSFFTLIMILFSHDYYGFHCISICISFFDLLFSSQFSLWENSMFSSSSKISWISFEILPESFSRIRFMFLFRFCFCRSFFFLYRFRFAPLLYSFLSVPDGMSVMSIYASDHVLCKLFLNCVAGNRS